MNCIKTAFEGKKKIMKGTYYQLRHFLIRITRHQNAQRMKVIGFQEFGSQARKHKIK